MYHRSHDISDLWMDKLFPKERQGCINFGYCKGLCFPITKEKRRRAAKQLYFLLFAQFPKKSRFVLEVGCGRGHGVYWLQQMRYEAYGIDILDEQIALCRKSYPHYYPYFQKGRAETIPFRNACFDVVYSLEAAQHFSSFECFCQEAHRTLQERGTLLIATYAIKSQEAIAPLTYAIPTGIEGFHNALVLADLISSLRKHHFYIPSSPKSLGHEIFPYYAAWHKQQLEGTSWNDLSDERKKWGPYYTGSSEEMHPWQRVYEEGLLDYYLIRAEKQSQ